MLEVLNILILTILGTLIITSVIMFKYKEAYAVVTNEGKTLYITNTELGNINIEELKNTSTRNIDEIKVNIEEEFEAVLVSRNKETDDKEYLEYLTANTEVYYKYYEILYNKEIVIENVDNLEQAEEIVNIAKEEVDADEIDLIIIEKFTTEEIEIKTSSLEEAKENIEKNFSKIYNEEIEKEEEEIRVASLPEINGVKLVETPVIGTITSRYGEYSRLRVSLHTGLDISAPTGTDIKAVSDGTVTFAAYNGSYGNKVVIDHGNGVETLYAHASKIYVSVGDKVKAGDVIAAVGSTGNSTGPHLHLEVIKDGVTLNPQNYLYN